MFLIKNIFDSTITTIPAFFFSPIYPGWNVFWKIPARPP